MIAHVDNRITYNGNGNATEFAYQFKILDRTDIKVLLTDADGKEKLLTKDYYVDVEKNVVRYPGYAVGAEVPESERPPVLPTGWKLTIYREVPVTQETDLPDQYPFNQVEAIGDKLTMIAQQLTDVTSRSLKISVSKSADIDTAIPFEAGKSFRIADDGKSIVLTEDPAIVLPLVQSLADAAAKSESNAKSYMDVTKGLSENVNVFIPSVSSDGVLTWTNKAGLANPAPVNVKGERGDKGEQGPQGLRGEKGDKGDAFKYTDFTSAQIAALKGPKGDKGEQGVKGDKGDKGEQGVKGDKGDKGEQGVKGDKGDTGAQGVKGDKGNTGAQGAPATIRIGTVTTGEPGTEAGVTNSGTRYDAIFNFVIPRGYPGSGGGSSVDVDYTLSATSLNPIANKAVYNALLNKVETADMTEALNNKLDKTGTALYAQMDSKGYNIYNTYARKTDITGMVKSVNGVAPDTSGNVTIEVGGTSIIVDSALSATSENPVQNKVVYNALANKMNTEDILSGFALLGGATNIRWREGTQFIGSINAANYSGTARAAIHDGAGNNIVDTYAKKTDISGVVKSVNGTKPDTDGNVTIDISGGSGVSTSESNTWTALQNFHDLMLNQEKYTTYVVNGTSDKPVTSTMVYAVIGAFTLDLATLAGLLSASQSSVFTAYFAANADYSLTINNAGKLKYVGSASDIAITSAGLLLNIWMSKDGDGTLTSIVQANKLA